MESRTIHIIIVHYNNPEDTIDCLKCIEQQDYVNWKVFTVDNQSREKPFLQVYDSQKEHPSFKYFNHSRFQSAGENDWGEVNLIRSKVNLGYGGAINIVLQKLIETDSYCLLLNPDVLLDTFALQTLVSCAGKSPESIWGCKVMDNQNKEQIKYFGGFRVRKRSGTIRFIESADEIKQLEAISGGCLFTHCRVFQKVGLFPEDYFLYWEDADWCRTALKKGIPLLVCEKSVAYDKGSTTIGKGYLAEYYYTYNALKYLEREPGSQLRTVLLYNALRALKRLLLLRFPNFRAILTASFHYVISREAVEPIANHQDQ